jgi:hypothetical protein
MIEFVTASHNAEVLKQNLERSKIFSTNRLIVQRDYTNVSKAYNEAQLKGVKGKDVAVYVHHDVFLPPGFETMMNHFLTEASKLDPDWGVIGCAGVKLENYDKKIYGHILDRGKEWGTSSNLPHEVDTLDELLLITRGDFLFDENLEQDFYGADICMQAKLQGRKNYAINAYCHHNSSRGFGKRTDSFFKSEKCFRTKYKDYLPIATTCTIVE